MFLQCEYHYNPQDPFDGNESLLYKLKAHLDRDLPSGNPINELTLTGFNASTFDPNAKTVVFQLMYRQNVTVPVTLYVKESRQRHTFQRNTYISTFETVTQEEFEQLKKSFTVCDEDRH